MTRFALGIAGEAVQADTLSDLIPTIIGGYDKLLADDDITGALFARYDFCVAAASTAQAMICERFSREDPELFDSLSEGELTALFSDKGIPLHLPYLDLGEEWVHIIPLVLVRTDYQPFTALQVPRGNVIMLDPYTERSLLASVSNVGELDIKLFINEEEDAG